MNPTLRRCDVSVSQVILSSGFPTEIFNVLIISHMYATGHTQFIVLNLFQYYLMKTKNYEAPHYGISSTLIQSLCLRFKYPPEHFLRRKYSQYSNRLFPQGDI